MCLVLAFGCALVKSKKVMTLENSEIAENVRLVLQETRELVKIGDFKNGIIKLAEIHDDKLSPLEKAFKYNLKGVCHFGSGEIEKSLANFEIAEKYAPSETQIYNQIQLNMAGTYFKLDKFEDLKLRLEKIDKELLQESELKKLAQLNLFQGYKFRDSYLIFTASVDLMHEIKSFSDIMNHEQFSDANDAFNLLTQDQKNNLFELYSAKKNLAFAYFAQVEMEKKYSHLEKSAAEEILSWLESEHSDSEEIKKIIADFKFRLENSSKISLDSVGLVLPMTGSKSNFGLKALSSIDASLKLFGLNEKIKIYTKDSADSPSQGAEAVLNLIKDHNVAFIIGGLFPESAKVEYLEAKKFGVLYISLSQINLPREEKNQFLIEVQGSIESQVEVLLSNAMIEKFGNRVGVIYPDNDGGKAYLDEIWKQGQTKNIQITSVASFPRNSHDFRETAEEFLGLKYPRERSEELKILQDVYSFEKKSIRRIQTLPPVLDFDWIFLASYPQETAQLVPTLGYFDANKLKVVGGPSWSSKSMLKEQKLLGTLYFVGDDPKDLDQNLLSQFAQIYAKPYGLIEVLALDAVKVGAEIFKLTVDSFHRDDFDRKLTEGAKLQGLASEWNLKNSLWLKSMSAMTASQGELRKIFVNDPVN